MGLYSILEIPWVYNLVQRIFAAEELQSHVKEILQPYKNSKVLELGSGTGAFTQDYFNDVYVSDVNSAYLEEIPLPPEKKLILSASDLTPLDSKFDMVYSVGLYHHLSDEGFLESIRQVRSRLENNGRLIVIDNIWPTRFNPFAWLVRRLDRGGNVRSKKQVIELVGSVFPVSSVAVGSYSWCGLEYVIVECHQENAQ